MKKLVLIDANALIHRAFHALPALNSPLGVPTNAVYGFVAVLLKMLKDLKPDYIAAAFDLAGKTFRHEEFADYKVHRVRGPDELYAQIPLVRDILEAFGIPIFEQEGYEADDLIGSLVEKTKDSKELQTIIVTGDLDTLQLVKDDKVVVFTLKKGVTDTVTYNEKEVKKRFGFDPEYVVDYKGLKGDPSDNIPGVPGIGEKTASTLIQDYGTIEELYSALEKGKAKKISPKLAEKLLANKDMAFFSKKLGTIVLTLPVNFDLEKGQWQKHIKRDVLEQKFKDFGFFSLLKRLPELFEESLPLPQKSDSKIPIHASAPQKLGKHIAVSLVEDGKLLITDTSDAVWTLNSFQELEPFLKKDTVIIGHDLKPWLKDLLNQGISIEQKLFDTQTAAYLLQPDGKNYDFERVYYLYLNRSPWLDTHTRPAEILKLHQVLSEKMASEKITSVFEDIEMPLMPVLACMEHTGIAIDTQSIKKLLEASTKAVAELERKIFKLAGKEFNINSPAQLSEILYATLSLKARIRKTGGGALSTAASELEKIRDLHPIVPLILEYREIQKLKNTYIEPFPHLVDEQGRIHTTYLQTGAATGRLSSENPNLQNIPTRTKLGQQFRKAFISSKGFDLITFDYSQLELRLVAHLAKDQKMIETFRRGEDIHTRTAAEIFNVEPDKVTKEMRRQAKVLNFGIIYGMGPLSFSRTGGVSRDQAREFIDRYFKEFSGVAKYMETMKAHALKHGYVQTLFGRKRPLPDITSTEPQIQAQAERMAINQPVQGTEADLIKMAMIKVDDYVKTKDLRDEVRMLLQVHDELVFEIKSSASQQAVKEIVKIMSGVYKFDVPMTVDVKSGKNWSEVKTYEALPST